MKYFRFSKLVRDKILDHIKTNGQEPRGVKTLKGIDYLRELTKKVVEESKELTLTTDSEELKEELADVQELLDYLKKELKLSDTDLKKLQAKKVQENGGFDKRIYIESVGVEKDNKWYDYYVENPQKYPEVPDPNSKLNTTIYIATGNPSKLKD